MGVSLLARIGRILLVALVSFVTVFGAGKPFTHRFLNGNVGMQKKSIDSCIARMRNAASLGYNGFVVTNWEDNIIELQGQEYLNNAKRAVSEAKKLKMALIPRHFHQSDVSYDNFNLAEAFPVRGTKFKVANGKARAIGDHETGFKNGGFESITGGKPTGWEIRNLPGAVIETSGPKEGKNCLRMSGGGNYAHIRQRVTLKPFRAYRLSAWIKTKGVTNYFSVKFRVEISDRESLLDKDRPFATPYDSYHKGGTWSGLSPNQSWRLSQADFNSLDNQFAYVQFVVSPTKDAQKGTVWLDDMRLEEVGLYETVRSPTRPIIVKSADGSKSYVDGTDYVVDPKCNTFTVKSFGYEGHLQIPAGSSIQDRQELRVDWYQMADVAYALPEANFCLSETREAARDNIRRIDELYEHSNWMFLGYDEWRTAFWDDRCELFPKAKTAGDYLSGTLQLTLDLLRSANPCREAYLYSDMFDVYHNAYFPYYATTNGGCQDSWKNMDTNIVIIQWNACGYPWNERSLRFYMGLDDSLNPEGKVYRQVLNVLGPGVLSTWLNYVEKAEKEGGRGVVGICYIDWEAKFTQMVSVKNLCQAHGRWGSGPLPEASKDRCRVPGTKEGQTRELHPRSPLEIVRHTDKRFAVKYRITQNRHVDLRVFDLQGREVRKLVCNNRKAGQHGVIWDANALPAGMYFLRLKIDGSGEQMMKQVVL